MKAQSSLLRRAACAAFATLALTSSPAASQQRPLDHDAYDIWRTIQGESLSPDGEWVLYRLAPRVGDATLVVRRPGGEEHTIERVSRAAFSPDSRFAVFTIVPAHDSVRALKLAETKKDDLPHDTLGILSLETGAVTRVPSVGDWSLPEEAGGIVVYTVAADSGGAGSAAADTVPGAPPPVEPVVTGEPVPGEPVPGEPLPGEPLPGQPAVEPGAESEEDGDRDEPDPRTLVIRQLGTGAETRIPGTVDHVVARDGSRVAYARGRTAGGVVVVAVPTGDTTVVMEGQGSFRRLAFSEDARQLAFLAEMTEPVGRRAEPAGELAALDSVSADPSSYGVYHWRDGRGAAELVAAPGAEGLPAGWEPSVEETPWFSESGGRLFFGSAPPRSRAPEDSLLPEERVKLDVWHWQDDLIQPMQLLGAEDERKRAYTAVVHLGSDRVVQLATPDQPEVEVGRDGDADVALADSDVPYRHLIGIEAPGFSDVWIVDVRTGARERVLEERQLSAHLSPDARYLAWYDFADRHWHALDLNRRREVNLTAAVPFPVWDEEDDHPMPPGPYGVAGWTSADDALLVYDRYDIWAVDPDRPDQPRRVTEGYGRENGLVLRHVRLDPDADAVEPGAPALLSAFSPRTKEAGFFRDRVQGAQPPQRLVLAPKQFDIVQKAEESDVLLYTREDVAEFPDLWVADLSFEGARQVSEANPQQDEYRWAGVELVEWLSTDGIPLQGLLYRPTDFDPSRSYPMMVTFYERSSDNLHQYAPPLPHRSVIRPTFYASRGYVVFVPDIVYHDGYPGESAMNAVMPGVLMLAAEPWVDEENVGVQGHSWGGYQIAYMLTRTDFFKAAEAGAPVANMTSAYGGIRYGSGMSRMFQYEHTQSRIGGTLWEAPIRYLENSPLFFLDKVTTPLLIMHNDQDGAVPWTQGIELFVGLRRLGKPAWLINYNDEPHWPTTPAHIRDWNIRMQQFFDHYLKGAAAPEWLAEGIPATEKGRTLGLDPVPPLEITEGAGTGGGNPN